MAASHWEPHRLSPLRFPPGRTCRWTVRLNRAARASCPCRQGPARRSVNWLAGTWLGSTNWMPTLPPPGSRLNRCLPTRPGRRAWAGATSITAPGSCFATPRRCGRGWRPRPSGPATKRCGRLPGWRLRTPVRGASGPAWVVPSTRPSPWRRPCWIAAKRCSGKCGEHPCSTSCSAGPGRWVTWATRPGSSPPSTRWSAR